jgi:hypothetical protein
MDFQIVKMYKDKVSTKMSKIFFLSMYCVDQQNKLSKIGIRVITKLSNSEQSNKGKVKTHRHLVKKHPWKISVCCQIA